MLTAGLAKLTAEGPAGLAPLPTIPPAALSSGTPLQRGAGWHVDASLGLRVGVWDCTAMETRLMPQLAHEFMYVLEGGFEIEHADGTVVAVTAGQAAFIPQGTRRIWRQSGYCRKYYFIWHDSAAAAAPETLRGLRLDPPADPDASEAAPIWQDPAGRLTLGLSQPDCAVAPSPATALMLALSGAATLAGSEAPLTLAAGEVALVTAGVPVGLAPGSAPLLFCALHAPGAGRFL